MKKPILDSGAKKLESQYEVQKEVREKRTHGSETTECLQVFGFTYRSILYIPCPSRTFAEFHFTESLSPLSPAHWHILHCTPAAGSDHILNLYQSFKG